MRLRFVIAEMFSGIRRNLSMALSVVLVTFVSLMFVGAALLLQAQVGHMKNEWYDKVEVTIQLCPTNSGNPNCPEEATQDQIDALEALLDSPSLESYVQKWYFESKQEAYENFRTMFGGDDNYESITADDLAASLRVKLVDPTQYEVIAEVFTNKLGVDQVLDQKSLLDPFFKVLRLFTYGSLAVAGVMLVAAVLLITTTIRLSAQSRRRETEIMRLVGSSNLFIYLPFMLEGALAAGVGALLATGALWLSVKYVVGDVVLATLGNSVGTVTTGEVWTIAPVLVGIAIVLAVLSSLVTLSRYTKV